MVVNDMIGEECLVCHQEAFQFTKREVTVKTRCCVRCAQRIDMENEDKTFKESIAALEKLERLQAQKERSFNWANSLHGKPVTLFYLHDLPLSFGTPSSPNHVEGVAYRTSNASGGWGQVIVLLSPIEHSRVSFVKSEFDDEPLPCIDGDRWGLQLAQRNGDYWIDYISWGCRKALVER